jgi:glutaredoxin
VYDHSRIAKGTGMNRLFKVLLVLAGLRMAWTFLVPHTPGPARSMSTEAVADLAKTVKAGDVIIYTTANCQYCDEAKSWMQHYGFAFRECNVEREPHCQQEFSGYRATGVPFLLIRGRQMRDGFDADLFLAALQGH